MSGVPHRDRDACVCVCGGGGIVIGGDEEG